MFSYSVPVKYSKYDEVVIESDVELDDSEVAEKAIRLAKKMFDFDEVETGEIELESRPTIHHA